MGLQEGVGACTWFVLFQSSLSPAVRAVLGVQSASPALLEQGVDISLLPPLWHCLL
jgi:hypothetical protein